MNAHLYLAFVVTTTILVLVPGPVIALTVSHSVAHGWRRALATVAGATCSIIVQLIITALGIASILLLLSDWFEVLRWASVAYLIYLGIQQWRAPIRKRLHDATTTAGANRLFWQGFLVSSTNPKSLIFYAVFFPQFIDPTAPPVGQIALLSFTFLVVFCAGVTLYALLAQYARGWLRAKNRLRLRNRLIGGLLIGAGLGLAAVRRNG